MASGSATFGAPATFAVQGDQSIVLSSSPGTEGELSYDSGRGRVVIPLGPAAMNGFTLPPLGFSGLATLTTKRGPIAYGTTNSQFPVWNADASALVTPEGDEWTGAGGGGGGGLQPGANLTQSAVDATTAAGASLLAKLVYVGDFASRPASADQFELALFTGTIGGFAWTGLFFWNGAAWRPAAPVDVYFQASTTDGVNTVTTEQTLLSLALPAGMLMSCKYFGLKSLSSKTGVVTTSTVNVRIGTTGGASDVQVGTTSLTAANRSIPFETLLSAQSATVLRRASALSGVGFTNVGSSSSAPTDTTVSDMTGALYLSVGHTLGATGSEVPRQCTAILTLY